MPYSGNLYDLADGLRRSIQGFKPINGCYQKTVLGRSGRTRVIQIEVPSFETLIESIVTGDYQPKPARLNLLKKPDGSGHRPLHIPVQEDRLIQKVLLRLSTPSIDTMFISENIGFRTSRCQHDGVAYLDQFVQRFGGVFAKVDIKKFFERINHERLFSQLPCFYTDPGIRQLIWKFVTSPYQEDATSGNIVNRTIGLNQGAPLSPQLANIYLHELDLHLRHKKCLFYRYADDVCMWFQSIEEAEKALPGIIGFLKKNLHLEVNMSEQKSGVYLPYAN